LAHLRRASDDFRDGVRAFECGDDAFQTRQCLKRFERLVVGGVGVFHAALIVQPGVFGADGGVIQAGADAVGGLNLPELVLHNVTARAFLHAKRSTSKARRLFLRLDAFAARFQGGSLGELQVTRSYILQDEFGQIQATHSVSAGLDYAAVGPEHAFLKDASRAEYTFATDDKALEAFMKLARLEGIIPALKS